ncbi:MAG: hypothetical protein QNK20_01090 [Aureibaculum sp.]|nr:hypothetical protein [Aureibaculum sp.]
MKKLTIEQRKTKLEAIFSGIEFELANFRHQMNLYTTMVNIHISTGLAYNRGSGELEEF